jgi:hypothetical protein
MANNTSSSSTNNLEAIMTNADLKAQLVQLAGYEHIIESSDDLPSDDVLKPRDALRANVLAQLEPMSELLNLLGASGLMDISAGWDDEKTGGIAMDVKNIAFHNDGISITAGPIHTSSGGFPSFIQQWFKEYTIEKK